ncbi:MAG: S1 family peptidase [Deltaproteobacteria bacterium]|nr:S1 family peptidase [Deltaproteobacteria bacterium]
MVRVVRLVAPVSAALLGAACQQAGPVALDAPATLRSPIVNGDLETGWPAVGALTIKSGGRYYGSFCSGTLVAPSWVITAGHCVAGDDLAQQGITPATTFFYIGDDARPRQSGALPAGRFVQADAFVPHPEYDARRNDHDLGLVHLAEPVTDVEPLAINSQDLAAWFAAWDGPGAPPVFTVGFGAIEGVQSSGSGVKRSTTVNLDEVYADVYLSEFVDTGTCFGDSGGPSFLDLTPDATRIIGITSAGGPCPPSDPDCDPCTTETYYTRVDAYAAWITPIIEGPAPDCQNLPSMCACPEACTTSGTCDPDVVCRIEDCNDTYRCVRRCDGDAACEAACMAAATDEAQAEVVALRACTDEHCPGLSGPERRTCQQQHCPFEYQACYDVAPIGTGDQSCEDVYACSVACQSFDCLNRCLAEGTADAQAQYQALQGCLRSRCNEHDTEVGATACAHLECREVVDACFPRATGPISCGDVDRCTAMCPAIDVACPGDCYDQGTVDAQGAYDALALCLAEACGEASDAAACRAASCAGEDAICNPPAPRAEGESCAAGEACAAGLTCEGGVCTAPCGAELCGNGADDDCDGEVDEGCDGGVGARAVTDEGCGAGGADPGLLVLALGGLAAALRRIRRSVTRSA